MITLATWLICLEIYEGHYRLTHVEMVYDQDKAEVTLEMGRYKKNPDWFFPITRGEDWECE